MILDPATRNAGAEGHPHEIFRGSVFVAQAIVVFETEAPIIGWFAEQHTPGRTLRSKLVNTLPDQRATDADTLPVGVNGNGPEAKPTAILAVDGHRREG